MDSVSDLVGVTIVATMIAWGWWMTRDAWAMLFPAVERDEVIVLP